MLRYATHAFANRDSLLRAVRWLMLLGFDPGEIEINNNESSPRVSVLASSQQSARTAECVFEAVEHSDPDGWPSFWDLSRKTFVTQKTDESAATGNASPSRRSPIGWHPPDDRVT